MMTVYVVYVMYVVYLSNHVKNLFITIQNTMMIEISLIAINIIVYVQFVFPFITLQTLLVSLMLIVYYEICGAVTARVVLVHALSSDFQISTTFQIVILLYWPVGIGVPGNRGLLNNIIIINKL